MARVVARRRARRGERGDPRPRHDRVGRRPSHLPRDRTNARRARQVPPGRQFGAFRDRDDLARWEGGQDRVALLMYNRPEHVESILGCWKARVVPCNVNYHYTAGEVADLLQRIGARGVIYDRRLGEKLADIADEPRPADRSRRRVTGIEPRRGGELRGALDTRRGQADVPVASPDDVLHRVHRRDHRSPQGGALAPGRHLRRGHGRHRRPGRRQRSGHVRVGGAGTWFPTSPLMHVAAQWTTFAGREHGSDRRAPRRLPPVRRAHDPRDRGPRAREHDDDRRRRVRAAHDRRAATDDVRPLQPGRHRHRRRTHELRGEARADGAPARRHHPRRLRRVRDRGDGIGRDRRRARPTAQRFPRRRLALGCCRPIARASSTSTTTRSAGSRAAATCRSATSTTKRRRSRRSRSSTASGSRSRATGPATPPTARSCCSDVTRWW